MPKLVITGISRGIGRATADYFLKKGWEVIGSSTSGISTIHHKNLTIFPLDLSSSSQIKTFATGISTYDVLINNAAVLLDSYDETEVNRAKLEQTFSINLFGTVELTENLLPKISKNGQIINITSGWGAFSTNESAVAPHYKMSKASLNMYTLLLSQRLPDITISSIDPGWVKTDMGSPQAPKSPEEVAMEIYTLVITDKKSGGFWHNGALREW
ncbi:oxidoreductase [Legionella adelaidensis]|uniref:Oxidoreductase n=2 Tax=Legionella adelaidensis TaxID=45056 RepID=A0A0W0R3V0_9GAMM|nr:SDR family NAD(P)-dependent oxidoreductase [Legionella adelaidensis]KTC65759.1 oxidoreductase [Legionella adelaidensis]